MVIPQMEAETPELEMTRLRRELAHVGEQCQVAHAMAMDWRKRALKAEEQCQRLQAKYDKLRRRKGAGHDVAPDGDHRGEEMPLPQVR